MKKIGAVVVLLSLIIISCGEKEKKKKFGCKVGKSVILCELV